MGERTGIAWTEKTWNPWMGCERVSAGCDHCYMFSEQTRYGHDPNVVRRSKTTFTAPLRWKEPARVFTCSWSDWFHADADQWRDEAWAIIKQTPHLTYQILTKRPARIARHLPSDWGSGYPNVWLGVSAETQEWYTRRASALLDVPARVHFVSAEPLLGPIIPTPRVDWVIAGGESGPGARPCEEAWLRRLRDDCAALGTAFYLKQLGGVGNKRDGNQATLDGWTITEYPHDFAPTEEGSK